MVTQAPNLAPIGLETILHEKIVSHLKFNFTDSLTTHLRPDTSEYNAQAPNDFGNVGIFSGILKMVT